MPSPPLDNTHGRTTSCVTCHHRLWTTHSVKRHRVWHAIITVGQDTRSNDARHGMPPSPLGITHGQITSGVACPHRLWAAHTVGRRRVWHDITALGQHTRSATSGVACHHHPWTTHTIGRRQAWHDITALGQHTRSDDVGRGMTSPSLDGKHGRTTWGLA